MGIYVIIGTSLYCSPEVSFEFVFDDFLDKKFPNRHHPLYPLSDKEMLESRDKFTEMIREKHHKNCNGKFLHRYIPEMLFGMTWQERYEKWKHYDTLPILKNDDLNKDLWTRYSSRTPRMFKASDIWSIGVIGYILICGTAPFYGRRNVDIMEYALTHEYTFAAEHPKRGQMTEDDYPLIFAV